MRTTEEFYPALDGIGRVGVLNVFESLIKDDITGWSRVLAQDLSGEETPSSHPSFLQLDPASECQLY